MITPAVELGSAPLFRREVQLDTGHGAVAGATCTSAASASSRRARRRARRPTTCSAPAGARYEWRLRYRSYDVTDLRRRTPASSRSWSGNGWYRGRLGFSGARALYGDRLGVVAELEIDFEDGHRQVVRTDEHLDGGRLGRARRRPVRRRRRSTPAADRDDWSGRDAAARRACRCGRSSFDTARLAPYIGPPVTRQETLHPATDLDLAGGPHAGRLRPEPRRLAAVHRHRAGRGRDRRPARRGARARRARHPPAARRPGDRPVRPQRRRRRLRADADLPRVPLRRGQRLARRHHGRARTEHLEAVVVHSDLRRIGTFECSDALLNQLHRNVVWGTQGQLPRRAHRLPAARRAARLDR